MTDIDRQADLEVHFVGEHMTVKVPLAGPVTGEWLQYYQKLALAAEVRAQAETHHDRAWIIVTVPAGSDQGKVAATLDAARALIAEADAAAERPPATVKAEAGVRDWWARSQGSAPRRSVSGVEAAGVPAEKRWPMAFTLVVAMVVPLLLPPRFSLGQSWAVPAVEALLLAAIVAIDGGRIDRRSVAGRALSLGLVAVLVADAAGVTGRLVVDLVEGGPETNSAVDLLKTGFLVWFYTIIAFAFLYWVLDGGGPESRFLAPLQFPDLAFPEQLNPGVSPPGWRPEFFDYLYLGFTDATAFSPTDVMPACPLGQIRYDCAGGRLPDDPGTSDCPGGQHLEVAARLRWNWRSSISRPMTAASLVVGRRATRSIVSTAASVTTGLYHHPGDEVRSRHEVQ